MTTSKKLKLANSLAFLQSEYGANSHSLVKKVLKGKTPERARC